MRRTKKFPADGGCPCRFVRFRMTVSPMFVHCCHCTWCQRETGSAFALNAMIETHRIALLAGGPELVLTPSISGKGQKIARCPQCRVALWSHYAGAGMKVSFVRAGTLDDPNLCSPDIHIFTGSKQDWVVIPTDSVAVRAYYDRSKYWSVASLKRREALLKRKDV